MTDSEMRKLIEKRRAEYEALHHEELEEQRAKQWKTARFLWNLNILTKNGATNEEILFFLDANSDPSIRVGGYSTKQKLRWLDRLVDKYKLDC